MRSKITNTFMIVIVAMIAAFGAVAPFVAFSAQQRNMMDDIKEYRPQTNIEPSVITTDMVYDGAVVSTDYNDLLIKAHLLNNYPPDMTLAVDNVEELMSGLRNCIERMEEYTPVNADYWLNASVKTFEVMQYLKYDVSFYHIMLVKYSSDLNQYSLILTVDAETFSPLSILGTFPQSSSAQMDKYIEALGIDQSDEMIHISHGDMLCVWGDIWFEYLVEDQYFSLTVNISAKAAARGDSLLAVEAEAVADKMYE